MSRWVNEHAYDELAQAAADQYGVPLAHVLATIAAESAFNPNAYRGEPQIADASRGLMQVLAGTAAGLGYQGDLAGLFDPATNIDLGTRLLRQNFDRASGTTDQERWDVAHAAYNSGWSSVRPGDAPRDASGQWISQPYVTRINNYVSYFTQDRGLEAPPPPTEEAGPGVGPMGAIGLLVALGLLASFFRGTLRGGLR